MYFWDAWTLRRNLVAKLIDEVGVVSGEQQRNRPWWSVFFLATIGLNKEEFSYV